MSAIAGVFSDFKLIKTRSCVQIVVEVPIEKADEALGALGGLPQASKERWVGIAPLTADPHKAAPLPPAQADPWDEGEQRYFHDLPVAQQAGIKCADADFQKWLGAEDAPGAASLVRQHCQITSRTELSTDGKALARWKHLLGAYEDQRLGRR